MKLAWGNRKVRLSTWPEGHYIYNCLGRVAISGEDGSAKEYTPFFYEILSNKWELYDVQKR